jgi:hypothetical protein
MMLENILRSGFALAHQRLGLIFLDILWKATWLAGTLAALLLSAAWFAAEWSPAGWDGASLPGVSPAIFASLLRGFWAAHRAELLSVLVLVLLLSAGCWFVLEAFFRRRIVHTLSNWRAPGSSNRPFSPEAECGLYVFLVSGVVKATVLVTLAVLLVPAGVAGASALAVEVFLSLAFFLTLIDTLVRCDAVDLFGTDLIRVTGVIGILLLFESMIGASLVLVVIVGFLNVARLTDALVMLGAAAVVIALLNLLHSYLLLVRFSAVGIMRRNVVEI